MITWTTPTLPVKLNCGQLEACQCEVYATFSQNGKQVTIHPYATSCDEEEDESYMLFELTQLQTGGFRPGTVGFQLNVVDYNDYRAASPIETIYIGSNVLQKELIHG